MAETECLLSVLRADTSQFGVWVFFTVNTSYFLTLLGGRVNESNNLVGCRCSGVLLLLLGFWRSHLFLQLQLYSVSNCINRTVEQWTAFGTLLLTWLQFPRSNNCEQDAVLISIINGCTSVYSATVIYSIIGFRATQNYDDCMGEWVLICIKYAFEKSWGFSDMGLNSTRVLCSNILKLMNAFDYAENNITDSNYNDVLAHLNHTNPNIIEGLNLETCDMNKFLSQVSNN